jgi:hypothetical protein
MDPDLATRSTRKIFSSDLLIFVWQVWTDAVWIECLSVFPIDLGSVRVDLDRLCLAVCEPFFELCLFGPPRCLLLLAFEAVVFRFSVAENLRFEGVRYTRWPFVPDSASAKQCQQGFGSGAPKAERIWRRMSLPDAIRPNAPSHAFC